MTRTVPAVVEAAVGTNVTQPIYLIRMGWAASSPDVTRTIATYAANITWNAETWYASGALVRSLDMNGGTLQLPNGEDDPWLALVANYNAEGKTVSIYEYQTSWGSPFGSDATLLFSGLMDEVTIDRNGIQISMIEGLLNKSFPNTSINTTEYTNLLSIGDRIYWGPDIVEVQ
jgi:hypothetical protein